jgi:hypothetical protein
MSGVLVGVTDATLLEREQRESDCTLESHKRQTKPWLDLFSKA